MVKATMWRGDGGEIQLASTSIHLQSPKSAAKLSVFVVGGTAAVELSNWQFKNREALIVIRPESHEVPGTFWENKKNKNKQHPCWDLKTHAADLIGWNGHTHSTREHSYNKKKANNR